MTQPDVYRAEPAMHNPEQEPPIPGPSRVESAPYQYPKRDHASRREAYHERHHLDYKKPDRISTILDLEMPLDGHQGCKAREIRQGRDVHRALKNPRPDPRFVAVLDSIEEETDRLREYMPLLGDNARGTNNWYDRGRQVRNTPTHQQFVKAMVQGFEKKRLFVCCDGTWKNASGTVSPMTNVAKLARAVHRLGNDPYEIPRPGVGQNGSEPAFPTDGRYGVVRQITYYSSGVGSQSSLSLDSGFSGITGEGVVANILSAYCFICNNWNFYSVQDEIVLVGFSRGAFTVRCLANFIDKVGLLRRKGLPFLRTVFNAWRRWGEADDDRREVLHQELEDKVRALRGLCLRPVKVKILAEWDTVTAMGLPLGFWREKLSFVNHSVPACVENAFLALALDEKRRSFKPRLWKRRESDSTEMAQCGFVGCHADVGGGNPDVGLSTVSLIWMVSKIRQACQAGFDETTLLQFMAPFHPSRSRFRQDTNIEKSSWWSRGPPEMHLRNFVSSEGRIHKSRTGWWLMPYYLSFGRWDGTREAVFCDNDEGPFCLRIHFTAHVLQAKLPCRLLRKYRHEEDGERRGWVSEDGSGTSGTSGTSKSLGSLGSTYLPEEAVSYDEQDLLEKWIRVSRGMPDEMGEWDEVDWEKIAKGLGWVCASGGPAKGSGSTRSSGSAGGEPLITSVARELQRRGFATNFGKPGAYPLQLHTLLYTSPALHLFTPTDTRL